MKLPFLALMAALALPTLAYADIPPPPGFEETCTVEKQSASGRTCRPCRASFRGSDHCAAEVGAGFARVCKGYGASVWTEVWCRDDGAAAADAGVVDASTGTVACDTPPEDDEDEDARPSSPVLAREVAGPSAESGGCNALGAEAPSLSGLVLVAGWLALRLRRRSAR